MRSVNRFLDNVQRFDLVCSLRLAGLRLIVIICMVSCWLMASQLLSDQTLDRTAEKKPIIIDVRSGNQLDSIDEELYIVDGMLRRFNPSIDMNELLVDGKHSIRSLIRNKPTHSETLHTTARGKGNNLQINLLASMIGQEQHDGFGISVAGVDDFNGDGYNDIIIGAPFRWGNAYLYFGGQEIDTIPDLEIHGDYSLGWSVASAGDVNGDGYGDFILGEPVYGDNQQGTAYIFWGGTLMGSYTMLEGDQDDLQLGVAVASLGDINKDGYDDVVVGTHHNVGSGRAYVYFGGAPMDTIPDLVLKGENQYDYFGMTVASAGDVNGDGVPDIIVGNGQFRVEKAYLYLGGALFDTIPDLILSGPLDSDFGWSVGSAGDINDDGYDDVMVSAHWYTEVPGTTSPGYGRVYIYYGGTNMDAIPDVIVSGTTAWACFGLSFSTLGDINFDGYNDIVVSAHCDYSGEVGKARVFLGGATMNVVDTLADAVIAGEQLEDWFSYSLSGTHDLNEDGLKDVIIGAHHHTDIVWEDGKTYVYSVLPGRRGNVNHDGKINVLDVVKVVNIIIGRPPLPTEYELWAADVNGDGEINVQDVMAIVNIILGFLNGQNNWR